MMTGGHPRPSGGRWQRLASGELGERRGLANGHSEAMSNASRRCAWRSAASTWFGIAARAKMKPS